MASSLPLALLTLAAVAGAAPGAAVDIVADSPTDVPPPEPRLAFAVTARREVSGGRLYPPFYNYVVWPHAVVRGGRVFCAFQDTRGRPVAMAYGIAEGRWTGPVRASDFGLGRDAHGNPSLCIDRAGRLHLFFGCHGGPMHHVRSARALDIAAWEPQPSPAPRATYPQSMRMADGALHLFYRAGGHTAPWQYRTSDDAGRSWGPPTSVVEMRREPRDPRAAAYCTFFPGPRRRTIHCVWNHKDDNAARVRPARPHPWRPLRYKGLHEAVYRYNVYYARREPDGTWRDAAGEPLDLPVSKRLADARCLAYDSGQEFTFVPYAGRLAVDDRNRPYLKVRTGVVDWVRRPDRVLSPVRSLFLRLHEGRWEVADRLPEDWPPEARAVIGARGLAAYGDGSAGRWFIFCTRRPVRPGDGSFLFLYNPDRGYATRRGGPARVESEE
ncbi:MAG: BNR-4 repeat-containing protein [Candidatus Brocadiia bacterium]